MKDYKSKTGNGLLAICMGKNYQDSMVVYREYVQNACDSIYEAMNLGYYESDDDKCIVIDIKPALKMVRFMDRGTGVPKDQIGQRLVDLGASTKNGIDQIGSNGIGRLVGANWCDKIIFETSAKGENEKSILTFDSKLAHELIKDKTGDCTDSLDKVTSYRSESEEVDAHYFRVTLENAKESLFNDIRGVQEYLASMVPVDYTYEFEDLIKPYLKKEPRYQELFSKLTRCHVTVNDTIIEKPYTKDIYLTPASAPMRITPPSFITIEDPTYGLLAWGWYAFNERIEQMNSLPYRGIRLRKHNMAIGSHDYLTKYFPRPVDANYFIGEIHIVHPNIHPTGTREAVETSESVEAQVLLYKLQNHVFPELKKAYENLSRLSSSAIAPIVDSTLLIESYSPVLKNHDLPEEAKQEVAGQVQKAKAELARATGELKKKYTAVKESQTTSPEVLDFVISKWNKEIDRRVSAENKKSGQNTQIESFTLEPIIEEALHETPSNTQSTAEPVIISTGNQTSSEPTNPTGVEQFKVLGKSEYKLMKQVYQILDAEKDLPPQIREKLKKKLLKKLVGK